MAYENTHCKRTNEVKVRLDDYDSKRLANFIGRFGGEKSVVARDAVIDFLDQVGERYDDQGRNLMLEERMELQALKSEVKKLHSQLGASNTQTYREVSNDN